MLPVFLGTAAVFAGLAALSGASRRLPSGESFGSHLSGTRGYTYLGNYGDWDVYQFDGPKGSFRVAMFPSLEGDYPFPRDTNVDYSYADGSAGQVVRAIGPGGGVWGEIDIPGPRLCDLFVYHSSRHPGDFPSSSPESRGLLFKRCAWCNSPPAPQGTPPGSITDGICPTCVEIHFPDSYGAVSWWLGGRGPSAGGGISSALGGRQSYVPYAWSGVTSSGYPRFRSTSPPPTEGEGSEEDEFGSLLGLPLTKDERLDSLESKIQGAKDKIEELEKEAHEDGADLDKISRQIAAAQSRLEKWEDRRDNLEMKMGSLDLDEDPSFGLEHDEELEEEIDEELFGDLEDLDEDEDEGFGTEFIDDLIGEDFQDE